MLGYGIDQDPGPILYIYPDENAAKEELKERISAFIEKSPRLSSHIAHGGWKTATTLEVGASRLYMAWASSPQTLIRRTIKNVFADEIDNCDQQAGRLGNTLLLAQERTTTFKGRSKVVLPSTPTIPEASAWRSWKESDRRHYYVPCPKCGTYQILRFAQIKVDHGERDSNKIILNDLAYYECEHCEARLKYNKHQRPLKRRSIVKRAMFDHPNRWAPGLIGDKPLNRIAGFHIWSAYSPWRTWSQILGKWFDVCSLTSEEKRVFKNSWLGEPWEDVVTQASSERMAEKAAIGLPRRQIPKDAGMITIGVDVQADRIYWVARAWGPHCESWLIDHGTSLTLDQEKRSVLRLLDELYLMLWHDRPFKRGGGYAFDYMFVDSGYRTRDIYRWCRNHPGTAPCKGESRLTPVLVRKSAGSPKDKSAMITDEARELWLVNADQAKETLYSWSNQRGSGPNRFHLHNETDEEWIHQFTAEHQVMDSKKQRLVWVPRTIGRANHYLDSEVYALAAAEVAGGLEIRSPPALPRQKVERPASGPPRVAVR
jgi:phage terminase large subunit GpA-like protein